MSNSISKWPENVPQRTAEEWTALAAAWHSDSDSRNAIVDALKALKIPATEYARKQPPERGELIIKMQEQLVPGSTTGKAAAPAKAPAAGAKGKTAAPKAAGTGKAAEGGGSGTVDLSPVLAALQEQNEKLDAIYAKVDSVETLLKLILLNPAMADSLQLASDPDVLTEFADKSISELASGNG